MAFWNPDFILFLHVKFEWIKLGNSISENLDFYIILEGETGMSPSPLGWRKVALSLHLLRPPVSEFPRSAPPPPLPCIRSSLHHCLYLKFRNLTHRKTWCIVNTHRMSMQNLVTCTRLILKGNRPYPFSRRWRHILHLSSVLSNNSSSPTSVNRKKLEKISQYLYFQVSSN